MEGNMNIKKKALVSIVCLLVIFSTITSSALVYTTQFYDNRSWTYTYDAPATPVYNCLAHALGNNATWIWPWSGNPTDSQVTAYLSSQGYVKWTGQGTRPNIISYGTTSEVVHFSRATSTGCTAKWGQLERFIHGSGNPYNTGWDMWSWNNPYYGNAVTYYY
jgi:hypothetical protein